MIELLIPASLIPLVFLVIWIRNIEKYKKQSWTSIIKIFFWGAAIATTISLLLENFVANQITNFLILSVIIVPVIEEIFKALGFLTIKSNLLELEDGLIYGIVLGFGFAATENIVYLSRFWDHGFIVIISLLYLRIIGSSFMHATATSIAGYGYGRSKINNHSRLKIIPYIMISILIHSVFNLFVYSALVVHQIIGIELSVMFAIFLMYYIRKSIIDFDNNINKKSIIILNKIKNIFRDV
jgi:RsiW-degrading membrane proteinase PrsW (M82 family)